MKKILLLLAFVMTMGVVNAKTSKLYSNFQSVANNNNVSWNSSTNTLSVWGGSANTYQMFSFEAGTLSKFEKLYIPIDDTNYAHIRIMLMNEGTTVFTGRFGSGGDKTITLEGWNSYGATLTKEQIATITSIRIGGYEVSSYSSESPCTISINPAKTYLSKEYEGNTTPFSSLSTEGTWPNTLVSLPATVSSGLQIVGKDNGVSDYADITDYHAIIFKITDFVTQGGGKIRAFICKDGDESYTTRYAYPVSNTSVANWSAEKGPSGDGYYYIDVTDYSRLVGIKTNNYDTPSDWKISEVYLVKKNLNITDGFDMADMVNDPLGATVNYDRAFTAGEKYTICLPFALTTAEVAGEFYELSSVSDDVLNFTTVTETEAYKPYIFVPSSTDTPFASLTNKAIVANPAAPSGYGYATTVDSYTFQGVLAATEDVKGANEGKYVYGFSAGDGTFVKVTGNSISVKAFRAYITVPVAKALSMGARSFMRASFGGGNGTTAIKKVETVSDDDPNAPVYNLAGQQVDASYKGIVIKNGKKYFQNK